MTTATTPTTLDGYTEALEHCRRLWPTAHVDSVAKEQGWMIRLSWGEGNPFKIVLRNNPAGAFADAKCSWGLSGMSIANSGIECNAPWEDAIDAVAEQLGKVLGPVVPALKGEENHPTV